MCLNNWATRQSWQQMKKLRSGSSRRPQISAILSGCRYPFRVAHARANSRGVRPEAFQAYSVTASMLNSLPRMCGCEKHTKPAKPLSRSSVIRSRMNRAPVNGHVMAQ